MLACEFSSADTAHSVKMKLLTELVRHNPAVRSCIQRVYNEVVPASVVVAEGGRELAPALQRFLGPWLSQFLEQALEMAYMCGFVVFVARRHEGIPVPVLLPLGSFTWSVELVTAKTRKRKREPPSLYRYQVRPVHPEVTADDIFVYNFQDPVVAGALVLPSPMDGLVAVMSIIRKMEVRLDHVLDWNAIKHITTSEKVDMPKDQTTDGISLLDDFRRYLNTGSHNGVNRFFMTVNGQGADHAMDPTDLGARKIHGSFAPAQGPGGRRTTNVHVLPPNTEVCELNSLDLKTNMLEIQEVFQRQVIQFFHMTAQPDINQKTKRNMAQLSDIKYMRHMSRFAGRLLQFVYACVFDVPEREVQVSMMDPSGINIESTDDIKTLHETSVLLPSDRLKLRKRLMQNV